jgi:hypothetical protein
MIHLFPQQILLLYFSSPAHLDPSCSPAFFPATGSVAICLLRLLCVEVRDDDSSFVLIPFIFSPRRQHLGRWHRHRASWADGTVAADHFHRLLAANAPAAGTVVERRGRPLAPLAQATSYADPIQLLALLLPHPHRHPAPGGWHPCPYRHPAPAGRWTAPTPFRLTAGRRLAFVGLTASRGRGLDL